MSQSTNDTMLDMFLFESSQLIEQLEQVILLSDKDNCYTEAAINEIFRVMHTIKGSAAMMTFNEISELAHTVEDLFFYIREEKPQRFDCSSLSDLVLESVDFIKVELIKIKNQDTADGDASELIHTVKDYITNLKKKNANAASASCPSAYKAVIFFEEGCEMENVRAYTIIHKLQEITDQYTYYPADILDNDQSIEVIRKEGFTIYLKANCTFEEVQDFFMQTIFLKNLELERLEGEAAFPQQSMESPEVQQAGSRCSKLSENKEAQMVEKHPLEKEKHLSSAVQSIISVSVDKLDKLMDLVGEMVIAEAMVIQNPDLQGLELNNFRKAARQLNKITSEIQDTVMAVRMVPLSATFHKMNRIVRDMCKNLHKEVRLEIEGEETEVDKNIIEHISDPLMHLVRNSLDHGIETPEARQEKGKPRAGTVTLKAKNNGNDVLIVIMDDGKGLKKECILKKARENHLLQKSEADLSDTEIFNLVLLPGFSTKDCVTEYSGRGVGMDVVSKNIEAIGGALSIESVPDKGTAITLKIPLTLAIIDGMNIKVGFSCYTIPTIAIKESFRPRRENIILDPDGNEMIMVRGSCYPILRLHEFYGVDTPIKKFSDGIIVMAEQDEKTICIFADELLGQQQVVVKALPEYIRRYKKINGITGCTLLGDGRISLILDIAGLIGRI